MSHRMAGNRITARLVNSPFWEKGRRASLSGALAGTTLLELQFLQNNRNIGGTRSWAKAPNLIAPGIVACLRDLRGKNDVIVLSVRGFGAHRRRINGRSVELPSEAEIYLDYVATHKINKYEWLTRSDENSIQSELIFEAPDRWLAPVIRSHWEWNSIGGYVLQRRDVPLVLSWPVKFQERKWKRRRAEELDIATIYFEASADGTAMRIWSKILDEASLQARVNIARVNRAVHS